MTLEDHIHFNQLFDGADARMVQLYVHDTPHLLVGNRTRPDGSAITGLIVDFLRSEGIPFGLEPTTGPTSEMLRPKIEGEDYLLVGASRAIVRPDLEEIDAYGVSAAYSDALPTPTNEGHLGRIQELTGWSVRYVGHLKPE